MNCKKIQDYLSPYLDQALSREEMILIENHLEKCAACRQELLDLKETVYLINTLPESPLPIGFDQELHHRLMAIDAIDTIDAVKEPKESRLRNGILNLLSYRKQWTSLGLAVVVMLFLYAFINPLLLDQRAQSDMPLNNMVQNQKKADLLLGGNLEMAEDQLPEIAMDTQEKTLENKIEKLTSAKEKLNPDRKAVNVPGKSIQSKKIVPPVVEDESLKVASKEQAGQNVEEAAPLLRMAAKAPNQSIDSLSEKNILTDQDLELMIKTDEYEEMFNRISSLGVGLTSVLDVVYQNIDEETKGFIISVVQGAVPAVLAEINAMNSSNNSVNQDVYSVDPSYDQGESVSLKVIIKEIIE